ncbi:PIN domain-containing protein [Chamaesiphon sp. VAR_48_metabat_135_sub]|uniref:PIN domain-containing protein n=1 Tax=Chamaesiphon sp. VAR_48_metabat_135_sub TaxID=2964699 RepID=UPI00286BE544|nr:PIN domain-containing protein [Chamaesiphon sp. VAR_48_metabat_135_sub]
MQLFIDTNILLSFYALNQEDLAELSKLIEAIDKQQITLLLTDQIIDEFYRNREQRIDGAIKSLRTQTFNPQFPQLCEDYPEIDVLRESLKHYEQAHASLTTKILIDIKTKTLKADLIIQSLFSLGKQLKNSPEILDRARFRMGVGNPPGKNNSLGDAINWECLLAETADGEDLYFITGDKDYCSALNDDEFSDFLLTEWNNRKRTKIHFYKRLSSFCKEQFPNITLASARDKEFLIRDFVNSQSISATQIAIEKLSYYSEFTAAQVNTIVTAAISNRQVVWSIEDERVKSFLQSVVANNKQYLDTASLMAIGQLLN